MMNNEDPFVEVSDPNVKFLPPDYTLKEKIGKDIDIKQIFTPEALENAQKAIDRHKDSFLEWVAADMAEMDEQYKKASGHIDSCAEAIDTIEKIASRIKAQAGTFGFGLATLIAKSLCNFCNKHDKIENSHLMVIKKHIDTLTVIFNRKISGDGGNIGNELLDNMAKLVEKY